MSDTRGSPAPGNPPIKLLPPIGDQPIADVRDGVAYLNMAGFQMLQRIYSYLGQPGSAGTPTGKTVTQGIADATATANFAEFAPGIEGIATATRGPILTGFPPNGPAGPGGTGGVVLQQGTVIADGLVQVGPLLVLTPTSLNGEVWAPMVNGDPPGDELIGYPDGMQKGPTLLALPNGQCIMTRIA